MSISPRCSCQPTGTYHTAGAARAAPQSHGDCKALAGIMDLLSQSPILCQRLAGMELMHKRIGAWTVPPCTEWPSVLAILSCYFCPLTNRAQQSTRLVKLTELPQLLRLPAVNSQSLVRPGWVGFSPPDLINCYDYLRVDSL